MIQVDIDLAGNESIGNYADLKKELSHLDYIAYVGLSVSGKGFWGLIPLAYPERHKEQFAAIEKDFASWGIAVDNKPKNVVSLRGYSYDENAYYNHSAVAYEKCYEEPKPIKVDVPHTYSGPTSDLFGSAARTLEKQGIFYESGNRHNYLWQFARLCNRFGVSREECQVYVDSAYAYDEKTNWLDSYRRYAAEHGIYDQSTSVGTAPPIAPSLPPSHQSEAITVFGWKVMNEINEYGYPILWDS